MEYYTQWDCPQCGHENYSLGLNGCEHNGRPVFDVQMFSQEFTTCDKCGNQFGTGDIEIFSEDNGEEDEDDDDEDEEEESGE